MGANKTLWNSRNSINEKDKLYLTDFLSRRQEVKPSGYKPNIKLSRNLAITKRSDITTASSKAVNEPKTKCVDKSNSKGVNKVSDYNLVNQSSIIIKTLSIFLL